MEPLAAVVLAPQRVDPDGPVEVGTEYDFALFRALAAARRYAAALARRLEEPAPPRPLRSVPAPRTGAALAEDRGHRDWRRCEDLLARARELRGSAPDAVVAAAALAAALADRIPADVRGPRAAADLQALARAELGNARRVADDLAGAGAELSRALERAASGTGDPRLLARILDFAASLCVDRRRFPEALRLLDAVHGVYRRLGDDHAAGRALIAKGNVCFYALDLAEAVRWFARGLGLIDARREPVLALAVVHNLLSCLVDGGRFAEAGRLLAAGAPLYRRLGGPLDRLKARWLAGRIAAGLDDPEKAERSFREARDGFLRHDLPYDAALASLDLAALWLRQGRTGEIAELLDETVRVFRARGIQREAIAALLLAREAIARETAGEALLRTLRTAAGELQRIEREPARRG
jgi:tetratricopeptide (TPR) repeat protein